MDSQQDDNAYKLPKATAGDAAYMIAKAGLASVPFAGGAAAEIFAFVIQPPLERRRSEWMERVGQTLARLESQEGVRLEDLRENEAFIDTVLQATQIALRSSQAEKREALQNAILNSALSQAPEISKQQFFLYLVDVFTAWHLRLLDLFRDPAAWAKRSGHHFPSLYSGGLSNILESAYPELRDQRVFYDQVWKDLANHGLVNTDSLHSMMTAQGLMARRVSELGEEFLRFITEPSIT